MELASIHSYLRNIIKKRAPFGALSLSIHKSMLAPFLREEGYANVVLIRNLYDSFVRDGRLHFALDSVLNELDERGIAFESEFNFIW